MAQALGNDVTTATAALMPRLSPLAYTRRPTFGSMARPKGTLFKGPTDRQVARCAELLGLEMYQRIRCRKSSFACACSTGASAATMPSYQSSRGRLMRLTSALRYTKLR